MKLFPVNTKKTVNSRPARGLTMTEILIAVMIFGTALIPLITLFNSGNEDTVRLKNLTVAANLAREIIETVKVMPFDLILPDMELWLCEENPPDLTADPALPPGTPPAPPGTPPAPDTPSDAQPLLCDGNYFDNFTLLGPQGYYDKSLERYSVKLLVEPVTLPGQTCDMWGNDPSKLKKISVAIKWKDKRGENVSDREVVIDTMITKLVAHSNSPYHASSPMVEKQYGR
jgi:type II secretory pathway pseudopilin PulG